MMHDNLFLKIVLIVRGWLLLAASLLAALVCLGVAMGTSKTFQTHLMNLCTLNLLLY